MTAAGLAPGKIRTRVNNVRSVLRAAVRDRLIASDPSADVVLPRDRRREAAMTIPTGQQVGALLAVAEPRFRAFLALAAFAGLRLGEAAAAQIGDVDFLRRTLTVSRQVQRAGGGLVEIRAPKYGSERAVYLPDQLVQLLAQHVERTSWAPAPAAGSSRRRPASRRTRTRSGTSGGRRAGRPASRASRSTTCGTSTPPG